jgi:streptogrisin C
MVPQIFAVRLRSLVTLVCLVVSILPVGVLGANSSANRSASMSSPSETLRIDAETIAAQQGWDQESTLLRLKRQEAVGKFLERVSLDYSTTFGGTWAGDDVDGRLFVQFVGVVPPAVRTLAKQQGIEGVFLGGAKYSLVQLEARADRIHAELVAHGYPQVATAISVQDATIFAAATRLPGDTRPAEELRAQLSEESQASDISITFADEPIAGHTATYGGDKIFNSSTGAFCTSGFTVRQAPTGTYGVSTAGHCNVNKYQQENGVTFDMTLRVEHRRGWGDMEYHSTDSSAVFAEFYANTGTRRDTLYLESASAIKENNTYCRYGRTSGYICGKVKLVSVDVTFDGYEHRQLVAMHENNGRGGDSGGPWFLGNTAVGIHSGWTTINGVKYDTWSKADYLDEALAVVVYRK